MTDLKEKNFALEGEGDVMFGKIATLESAKAAKESSEYLQALGQAIGCIVNKGIQDGLKAGIDHGREVKEKHFLLTDVITPLVEHLSSKSLTGEASTSAAPITTLSMTFASSDVVLPTSVVSDQVMDAEPHNEDPSAVTFEKEELGTSSE
nr:hypothetical protein [Tanacetum cinerariifolium]